MKEIRSGSSVINAQLTTGYESDSGFRDAFSRIIGSAPSSKNTHLLKAEWIDTQLGAMLAIADDKGLYLLEFTDRRGLEREIESMRNKLNAAIIPGSTPITNMIKNELNDYFNGQLKTFKTPVTYLGTAFQQSVWDALKTIPYGQTRSYSDQAKALGNPKAVRAVANANGRNQLAILIPCHRVINTDGKLAGYSGGLARKKWLLEFEKSCL